MAGIEIRKDDTVMVVTGKDRGHTGRVVNVYPKRGRVMVEGAARAKRHTKPTQKNQQGGILDKEMPLDISNVVLWDAGAKERIHVAFKEVDGRKVRVNRKTGAVIDHA